MKQNINVLTLWAISLLSPLVVQSQTFKPAYLSEMPAPGRILAEVNEPGAIVAILTHLGMEASAPPLARARAPCFDAA